MINTKELARRTARRSGVINDVSRKVINCMVEEMIEALKNGENVRIEKFGVFKTFLSTARRIANPRNTDQIIIRPDRTLVKFKRADSLNKIIRDTHYDKL